MAFQTVNLYYFSGTGNTLLVVRKMKEILQLKGVPVTLHRIEVTDPSSVEASLPIGLAFPVAAQGTYPFVLDFIKNLPQGQGTPIFMVDTLTMFSGGVVGPVRKIVKAKGYRPIGAKEIRMPCYLYPSKTDPEKNKKAIARALVKAGKYARQLYDRKSRWRRVPFLSDLMSKISRSKRTWAMMRRFCKLRIITEKCTKCGLCVRLCPVGNIEMRESYPLFKDKCVSCLRCVSFCPVQAISMAKNSKNPCLTVSAEELLED